MENKEQRRHRRQHARGMTLIEIMVVITLIGIVMGMVTVVAVNMLAKGQIDTARTQAYEVAKALDLYYMQYRKYPSNAEGLEALVSPPGSGKPIMDRVPKDPWGHDYQFIIPGTHNPSKFDIVSFGPDEKEGGGDDVGNWPEELQE